MNDSYTFVDVSDAKPRKQEFWPTLIVPRAAIETVRGSGYRLRPDGG